MSAKHTPGPWTFTSSAADSFPYLLIGDDSMAVESDNDADARLIAAAPELLEALVKIVKYADSEPDGGETVAMHRANVERARAAIAKAEAAS